MVERYVRDVEAVGSNPVTSTKAYNKAICRVTNELEIDMLMCKPLRSYDLSGFLLLYNEYRYEYRLTKMIEENARKKCFCVPFVYQGSKKAWYTNVSGHPFVYHEGKISSEKHRF